MIINKCFAIVQKIGISLSVTEIMEQKTDFQQYLGFLFDCDLWEMEF